MRRLSLSKYEVNCALVETIAVTDGTHERASLHKLKANKASHCSLPNNARKPDYSFENWQKEVNQHLSHLDMNCI